MKATILFLFIAVLFSCKKDDDSQGVQLFSVDLKCHSTNPKFLLKYYDQSGWHEDTIRLINHSQTYQITEDDLQYIIQMKSLINTQMDSLHIQAEYSGKKIEQSAKTNYGGTVNVQIQLSNAQ